MVQGSSSGRVAIAGVLLFARLSAEAARELVERPDLPPADSPAELTAGPALLDFDELAFPPVAELAFAGAAELAFAEPEAGPERAALVLAGAAVAESGLAESAAPRRVAEARAEPVRPVLLLALPACVAETSSISPSPAAVLLAGLVLAPALPALLLPALLLLAPLLPALLLLAAVLPALLLLAAVLPALLLPAPPLPAAVLPALVLSGVLLLLLPLLAVRVRALAALALLRPAPAALEEPPLPAFFLRPAALVTDAAGSAEFAACAPSSAREVLDAFPRAALAGVDADESAALRVACRGGAAGVAVSLRAERFRAVTTIIAPLWACCPAGKIRRGCAQDRPRPAQPQA